MAKILTSSGSPILGFASRPMLVNSESAFALACGNYACVTAISEVMFDSLVAQFHRDGLCWVFDSGVYIPLGGGDPVAISSGELYPWNGWWGLTLDAWALWNGEEPTLCGHTSLPADYTLTVDDNFSVTITLQGREC